MHSNATHLFFPGMLCPNFEIQNESSTYPTLWCLIVSIIFYVHFYVDITKYLANMENSTGQLPHHLWCARLQAMEERIQAIELSKKALEVCWRWDVVAAWFPTRWELQLYIGVLLYIVVWNLSLQVSIRFNFLMFNRFKAGYTSCTHKLLKPVVSKLDDVGRKNVPNMPWNIESKHSLSQLWIFLPPDNSLLHRLAWRNSVDLQRFSTMVKHFECTLESPRIVQWLSGFKVVACFKVTCNTSTDWVDNMKLSSHYSLL